MKVKRFYLLKTSLEDFAEEHDLTLEIHERNLDQTNLPSDMRFFVKFSNSEIKEGSILASTVGDGASEVSAKVRYKEAVSGKLMVIDAMSPKRREIQVPVLT